MMFALSVISGITNAILNALLSSILQLTVPQDKRGKVFGLLETVSQGLVPLSFAFGGVLAEFIPLQLLISACFVVTLFGFIPMAFMPDIIRFINFEPEKEKPEAP
jgi:MFS family permease